MQPVDSRMNNCRKMLQWTIWIVLFCGCLRLGAQTGPVDLPSVQEVQKLAAGQHWEEIVRLLEPMQSRSADMNFSYGTALSRLERWPEAERAFQAGYRLAPADPRFPIELAGIAFRQKRYSVAAHRLRQAIKLAPNDTYANDFLGTVYFLEENPEASLKYWNRVGKPRIAEVREDPMPRVSPALLDRAFAMSPASTLFLPDFLDTDARIRGLGIFPQYQFDLRARDDGKFDLVFRSQERNGFGDSKGEALFQFLRGLPFQSVEPEYDNLHHEAINVVSLFRWDPQKRRILAQLSGPFEHSAKYRYELGTDLRNENWALRNSFTGPAPTLGSLNLRREALAFDLASYASNRMRWSAGAEASHRDFRSVVPGTVLTPDLLAGGFELKQQAQATSTLWRVPERRFTLDAAASSQTARLWSHRRETFEKLEGSVGWQWFPRATGDDLETQQIFRAGKTFGEVPFDELFMLGLERDNDLPMRAHIGTRDGRKGSAPLGRDYFLASWETDKNVYGNGLVKLKLGPFLDTGKITDSSAALGSHKWLWDVGIETKLSLFGRGFAFSYGKDLRSGNNAFYVSLLK
ncbi:MAG: tetratricopeptide repeat protein [Acidobacteriota bacterium]|nr:tetratricopeptide repeat protein [Acidobacteriota bacterium]